MTEGVTRRGQVGPAFLKEGISSAAELSRHRNAGCSCNQKCEGNQFTALECCKLAADFKIASISAEMRDIRFIYGTKFCWSGQVSTPSHFIAPRPGTLPRLSPGRRGPAKGELSKEPGSNYAFALTRGEPDPQKPEPPRRPKRPAPPPPEPLPPAA